MTLPTDLAERCRAFALALPDDVAFSHVTAARLWGLPLPVWAQDAGTLDVMRHAPPAIERASCRGHRGLERRTVRTMSGVRVTGLIDTWVDLAEVTQPQQLSVEDLVVVADEVLMRMAEQVEVRPGEEEWEAIARFRSNAWGPASDRIAERSLPPSSRLGCGREEPSVFASHCGWPEWGRVLRWRPELDFSWCAAASRNPSSTSR